VRAVLPYVRYVHLLAAALWMGGLVTMWAIVSVLRKAGAERPLLRAAARRFGWISWAAIAVAIATGLGQVLLMGLPWTYWRLHMKMGLVALTALVALVHQLTAHRTSPAARGVIEGLILLLSLGIFAAAVSL